MNRVVERRLAYWPDPQTRAEAARLFVVEGWGLARVLARYPGEVIDKYKDEPRRGAARRAIWAHYALIQEAVGEPDVDPDDEDAIREIIRTKDRIWAECRTGSGLTKHPGPFPPLDWYERQAPPSWPTEGEDRSGRRERGAERSAVCPKCFLIHAGECQ
jgi:hypothetical protein